MLDFNDTPRNSKVNKQIFYANSTSNGVGWAVWQKPRGINFLRILCLGGGGGGGAGARTTVGTGAGGGGGSSAAQTIITLPAFMVPDILYISVGVGGAGGTSSGVAGGAGVTSYVAVVPDVLIATFPEEILICSVVGGNGGSAGTSTGGGAGGTAPSATSSVTSALLAVFGATQVVSQNNITLAGQAGGVGSNGNSAIAAPTLNLPASGLIVTGGTGGGNYATSNNTGGFAGGPINGTADNYFPTVSGGAGGAWVLPNGLPGNNGSSGFQPIPNLPYFYGGTGGGGSGSTVGGNSSNNGGIGGNGGYGCGGGGGGGGFTTSTGGQGGNGGDGLVVITAW